MTTREKASILLSICATDHAVGIPTMILSLNDNKNAAEVLAYKALEAVKNLDRRAYDDYLSTPYACALAQALIETGEVT